MCRSVFLVCSAHRRLVPKRCWGIRFMIVCVMDPIRYSSDITIPERLHMWRMGGDKFTGRVPNLVLGRPHFQSKFRSQMAHLGQTSSFWQKKVIPASVAFRRCTTEAVLVGKFIILVSIVLFGIWAFFVNLMPRCCWCESRNQTCTYTYIYIYIYSYIYEIMEHIIFPFTCHCPLCLIPGQFLSVVYDSCCTTKG